MSSTAMRLAWRGTRGSTAISALPKQMESCRSMMTMRSMRTLEKERWASATSETHAI